MKKKHKTNILFLAVLLIWGAIAFQVYSRLNPPELELQAIETRNNFQKQELIQPFNYQLKVLYRDPFLGTIPSKKMLGRKKKENITKEIIPFPEVLYNGVIETGKTKSYVFTINSKQEFLKKGETSQNVKLISATKDAVIVQFEKQRKTIFKQ